MANISPIIHGIFWLILVSLKTLCWVLLVLLKKFPPIRIFFNKFVTSFPSHMSKSQDFSTTTLLNTMLILYPMSNLCNKSHRPIHPSKYLVVKVEIDKLWNVGYIYPIVYITWVSNPILVNKKQGTICVFTDFSDKNKVCTKDKLLAHFIKKLLVHVLGIRFYHLCTVS